MSDGRIPLLSDIFPPKTGGSGRWFREIYARLPGERAARNLPEGFAACLVRRLRGTPYLCNVHGEDVSVSTTSRELS